MTIEEKRRKKIRRACYRLLGVPHKMYYIKSTVRLNVNQMQEKLSAFKWSYSYIHILHIFNEAGKGKGEGGGGT
jgi:hypothetical protein